MNLYTDDDVERGVTALLDSREQTPFIAEHIAAVLDAVLPAYRKRLLTELADGFESLPDADYHRDAVVLVLRRVTEETP